MTNRVNWLIEGQSLFWLVPKEHKTAFKINWKLVRRNEQVQYSELLGNTNVHTLYPRDVAVQREKDMVLLGLAGKILTNRQKKRVPNRST